MVVMDVVMKKTKMKICKKQKNEKDIKYINLIVYFMSFYNIVNIDYSMKKYIEIRNSLMDSYTYHKL